MNMDSSHYLRSVDVPTWWLPPLVLWGVYMAVVAEATVYTHLFLPSVPFAVPRALVNVGMCWAGVPLCWMSVLVVTWMAVAWSGIMVAVIAGVVAFGVWISRTYSSSNPYFEHHNFSRSICSAPHGSVSWFPPPPIPYTLLPIDRVRPLPAFHLRRKNIHGALRRLVQDVTFHDKWRVDFLLTSRIQRRVSSS